MKVKTIKEFLLEKKQQFSIMGRNQDKEIFSIRRLSDNAFFELYIPITNKLVYKHLHTGNFVRIIEFKDDLIHLRIENDEFNDFNYLIKISDLAKQNCELFGI